jgi:peptidoglycan/LPS O-acetylase OafA/YrhL
MGTFFGRCIEFFLGMQLALIVLRSGSTANLPRATKIPFATIGGVLLMAGCLFAMSQIKLAMHADYGMQYPAGMLANNILFPLSVVIFFYGLIYERSWVQRFFASKPVELLGKSSYAFYLIHAGFVADFVYPLTHRSVYTFVILEVLAVLIFLLIERPLYGWITGLNKRTPATSARYQIADHPG